MTLTKRATEKIYSRKTNKCYKYPGVYNKLVTLSLKAIEILKMLKMVYQEVLKHFAFKFVDRHKKLSEYTQQGHGTSRVDY